MGSGHCVPITLYRYIREPYRLDSFLGRRHPNIFQVMEFINKEQAVIDIEVLQLQSGALVPPKKTALFAVGIACFISNWADP